MAYTATVERLNSADVLEDADSITIEITRERDGLVVLAATATGIVHVSTGIYTYDYSGLPLDPAETYIIEWSMLKAPNPNPLTVTETIQAYDQSRTLRGLRRALAEELGRYWLVETTGQDATSDAARVLVIDELVNEQSDEDRFQGIYAYIASGPLRGQQRRIRSDGYVGASGALRVVRPYTAAPTSGAIVELHGRLPAIDADGFRGLNWCLNKALRVTHHPHRLEFTVAADTQNYDLSSYPWLRHEQQLGVEFDPQPVTTLNPVLTTNAQRLRLDAQTFKLESDLFWGDTDVFQAEVMRPNFTYIRSEGLWGSSTRGLLNDDDETLGDEILVVQVAKHYAFNALADAAATAADRQYWQTEAAKQQLKALKIRESRQAQLAADGYGSRQTRPGEETGVLINRNSGWRQWS